MILFFLNNFHAQDNNNRVITAQISLELNENFIWFVITAVQNGFHIILIAKMKHEATGSTTDIF